MSEAHGSPALLPAVEDPAVAQVAHWVRDAGAVTVLTGAGISTESGIPDFRGPQGLWTRDPSLQRVFDIDAYVGDRAVRVRAWRNRRDNPAWTARPNDGHRALLQLERSGRLLAVVTQNIDGLHRLAGTDPARTVELHGTIWEVECLSCHRRRPTPQVLARVEAGEEDPACERCGGILKTATISFGQSLRPEVITAARDAALGADLFLAAGSSLTVQPAASLPGLAARHGARLVILNAQPTPYDAVADAVLRHRLGEVLPLLFLGLTP